MISVKITAIVCFLAVGFVYFYTPMPDEVVTQDQWLMRKVYAFTQAGKIVARIGALVGYDTAINITRLFRDVTSSSITEDTADVESNQFTFDNVPVTVHRKKSWSQGKADATGKPILRPAIFFIHGGGWIYEFKELYTIFERHLAQYLDVVVVSVHYRLSPEHPYPAPFLECLTAIQHLHKNAPKFSVDPDQISVLGDSAGGNLAAAVALKLRDSGENFLQAQILISPIPQFVTFRTEAYITNDRYGILHKRSVIQYFLQYMHESLQYVNELDVNEHVSETVTRHKGWPYLQKFQKFPQDHVKIDEKVSRRLEQKLLDPYLCPMMADSLGGLPPTLVLVSEFDVARDDGLAFSERLKDEGTKVVMKKSNSLHGIYCFFGQSVSGAEMMQSIIDYLKDIYSKRVPVKKTTGR